MADNIYTLLKFKNKESYDHFIKNYVTFGKDKEGEYFFFDLEKVIPYPTKENCPDQYNMESKKYDRLTRINNKGKLQLLKGREFLDWYNWCSDNWGTKWNTFENKKDDNKFEFKFSTAWASPIYVIRRLYELNPDLYDGLEGIGCCEFNGYHRCTHFYTQCCSLLEHSYDTDPSYPLRELGKIPLFKHLFSDWTEEGWEYIKEQHKSERHL